MEATSSLDGSTKKTLTMASSVENGIGLCSINIFFCGSTCVGCDENYTGCHGENFNLL